MSAQLFFAPVFQVSDANGAPYSGALAYFYLAGTTTALTVYQDSGLITPHANPVVADTAGMFAPVYADISEYKVVLKTSAGVTITTVDPVSVNAGSQTIESTNATAVHGPDFTLYRNSASPAVADALGKIAWTGKDSAGNTTEYASMTPVIDDPTNGSEDATLYVDLARAGTETVKVMAIQHNYFGLGADADVDTFIGRNDNDGYLELQGGNDSLGGKVRVYGTSHATQAKDIEFFSNNSQRYLYDASAGWHFINDDVVLFQSSTSTPGSGNNTQGAGWSQSTGQLFVNGSDGSLFSKTSDGALLYFGSAGTIQGSISVAGATVTYGAFFGAHWSQLADGSRSEILRGTICESIDQMCDWPGEGPEDRLPRFKISDTPASKAVYGVFARWDNDWKETNDAHIGSLGAYVIRIARGVTVQRGDLIESDGKGCGRLQKSDAMCSSTVAKVTSATVVETYPDGSYLVPCTLHCG